MGRQLLLVAALAGVALTLASSASAASRLYVGSHSTDTVGGFARGGDGSLAQIPGSPFPVAPAPSPVDGLTALAFGPTGDRGVASFDLAGGLQALSLAADGSVSPTPAAIETPPVGGLAVSPDGRYAYASTRTSTDDPPAAGVRAYAIGADGSLAELAGSPFGGGETGDLAITPEGGFLYAVAADGIEHFSIDGDGTLTQLERETTAGAETLAVSPDGRLLFVASSDSVASYAVAGDGSLTPNGPPVPAGGSSPGYFAVAPDGRHLYLPESDSGMLVTVEIAEDGTLSVVGSTPVTGVAAVAAAPGARHLYFWSDAGGGALGSASIGADGLPTVLPLSTPWGTDEPERIVFQPGPAPVARFTATPAVASAATRFDASGSPRAARFDWDFGDGTTLADGGPTPSHAYASPGSYDVRLTVTDESGCSTGQVYAGQSTTCPGGTVATISGAIPIPAPAPVPIAGTAPAPAGSPIRVISINRGPKLGRLSLTNRRFAVARPKAEKRTAKGKRGKGPKLSTRVRYTLSERARVRFTVERRLTGRRVGGRCRPATRTNAKRKRCVRWKRVGSFTAAGRRGRNGKRFAGRLGKRRLAPGRYRVSAIATDSGGGQSAPGKPAAFRIVAA